MHIKRKPFNKNTPEFSLTKRKPFNKNTPEFSLTDPEKEKIEDVFQVLVTKILQLLEDKLEISLASSEPLKKKTSDLVDEFLILLFQENIH